METELTFKEAVKLYRADSDRHFIKPVKSTSHFSHAGWFLLGKDDGIACICVHGGCIWRNRLAYYYDEIAKSLPRANAG
jgi:hypothetical protein